MGMLKEFKEFAMKGNVLDMAVGIIIGAAFGKIVTSLVNDVIMPPIGVVLGNVDFSSLAMTLGRKTATSGRDDSLRTLHQHDHRLCDRGVRDLHRDQATQPVEAARSSAPRHDQGLPRCLMAIPLKATRCGHCTRRS